MKTVFLRVLSADDKASSLLSAIRGRDPALDQDRFEVEPRSFSRVPRSPFVYWVSEHLRRLFSDLPAFSASGRAAKQGLATADDFRFIRAWWAVPPRDISRRWFPFAKGGEFSPYYADLYLVVNWTDEGAEIKGDLDDSGKVRSNVWMLGDTAVRYFLQPGLTWPSRPFRRGAFSMVSAGAIFSRSGMMLFASDERELPVLACILNSDAYIGLLHLLLPRGGEGSDRTLQYEVGYVTAVPIPAVPADDDQPARWFKDAWSLKRTLDTSVETSHAFVLPALLQAQSGSLMQRATSWARQVRQVEGDLDAIQARIDEWCFDLYDLSAADQGELRMSLPAETEAAPDPGEEIASTVGDGGARSDRDNTIRLAGELLSWAVGVSFGRFDVRLATGERGAPLVPDPFDSLPACSAGTLIGEDNLPLGAPPADYPIEWASDGILVDDAGHHADLLARVREVFEVAFGDAADELWQEASRVLGGDLRRWLSRTYFDLHLKTYSKSRRKAPIYWQLAPPSASYSVWLYAHRTDSDSFFKLLADFLGPRLRHEERQLTTLTQEVGRAPAASQRKEIEMLQSRVEELRAFCAEVARIAPLWRPDLDDGIIITCAPLWRLVPHSNWQRETRKCWTQLANGDFDWAQLAMHLWPERVVPKCAKDRSLANAHGLDDVFWAKADDGAWAPLPVGGATVERLIQERSSAAVKAALADLLAAG